MLSKYTKGRFDAEMRETVGVDYQHVEIEPNIRLDVSQTVTNFVSYVQIFFMLSCWFSLEITALGYSRSGTIPFHSLTVL